MNKEILFLGPLYPCSDELEIKENSIINSGNAPNVYQWNLLNGLHSQVGNRLKIINVLPVGIWKKEYKKLFLKSRSWEYNGIPGSEIGCVNLPFLKQYQRFARTKGLLRRIADENTEILIYSAYMPFLKAVYKLPKSVRVTAIITDLPEYYDLGATSFIRRLLRKRQNRMIYRYLERVDRFVVLTKQMCGPLSVGDRPWLCVEGICNADTPPSAAPHDENDVKAILYSGTLHYRFGIGNLLKAFERLGDESTELWICGSGEAEPEIKRLSDIDKRIRFFGFCTQSEVAELRARAAVLVNPRTNEGEYTKYSFPSKTMEYMASGKPVVMYKLDGIPDEYDKYLNYASSEPDETAGLRNAVIGVLNNYDNALKKAEEARRFVLEHKSGNAQAKRIVKFLSENQ